MPRYTFRQLEAFVAVADEGTIAAAADLLGLSPSAVASSLNELERALGHQLTTRRKAHGVGITPAGQHVLTEARSLLGRSEDLQHSLQAEGAELSGQVRIGSYVSLAPTLLVEIMAAFHEAHPRVDLDFVAGSQDEICAQVLQGRLDLAVTYDLALPPGLQVTSLNAARPLLVLPADHRLADQEQVRLAEVIEEPMIVLDISPSRENTARIFRDAGLQPHVAFRTSDFEVTRSLVAKGLGYAILVQRPAGDLSYGGEPLAVKSLGEDVAPLGVIMVRNPQLRPSTAATALAAVVDRVARQDLWPG